MTTFFSSTRLGQSFTALVLSCCFLSTFSGCSTTTSQSGDSSPSKPKSSASGSKSGTTKAGRRIILIHPDGTRVEIPDHAVTPKADFVAAPYEWNPELSPAGSVKVEVVLNEQKAYIYRNGVQIGYSQISTGKEGHNTPDGKYTVLEKKLMHHSGLYGSFVNTETGRTVDSNANAGDKAPAGTRYEASPMPFFQRLTWDGVGLHTGYLPGYPASHGCIRLHKDIAEKIYSVTKVGTPVIISHERTIFPTQPAVRQASLASGTETGAPTTTPTR